MTPFEHLFGDLGGLRITAQFFQCRLIGRVLSALPLLPALEAHLVEQNLAKLFGTPDGEFLACNLMDFTLERFGRRGEFLGKSGQSGAVDLDALAFHGGDHRYQRAVNAFINPGPSLFREAGFEHAIQPQGYIRIFSSIFCRAIQRHLTKRDGLFPRSADILESQRSVAEMTFGKLVHSMTAAHALSATGIEVEAHDHRVFDRRNVDSYPRQDVEIVFAVLEDFQDAIVLKHRFQRG